MSSPAPLVARVPVAGGTRAVAVAPDGSRGYVAAGAGVAAIDLNARARVGDIQLTGTPTAIALSASGHRLVAVRKGALDSIDPLAMKVTRSVNLGAKARKPAAVAISADGAKAVVALDAKRIAIVDLLGGGVRRMQLAGVTGIVFAPTGRNAFAATASKKFATLTTVDTARGRLGHRIRTAPGPGGGVAVSGDGHHVIVGAGRRLARDGRLRPQARPRHRRASPPAPAPATPPSRPTASGSTPPTRAPGRSRSSARSPSGA